MQYDNVTMEQLMTAQSDFFNNLEADNAAALSALAELSQRVYGYNHDDFAVDDIEAVYSSIIEENPELTDKSAVGFTALLKDGETIPAQGNILFINGVQEQDDYTFSGENSESGTELVTVWYFENNWTLRANRINANVIEISVNVKHITPAFSADFFNYADSVTSNINLTGSYAMIGVKKQSIRVSGAMASFVSSQIYEYENYCEEISNNDSSIYNKTTLKKMNFPFLKILGGNTSTTPKIFQGCTGCEEIKFPMLETIRNTSYADRATFGGVINVDIPQSVISIGKNVIAQNKTVNLFCKNAETIDDVWCAGTPTDSFTMCADWGATINIATAAKNWTKDEFISLFTNKLRDLGDDVQELKIPSDIYDSLSDEEFEIAEDKGWTVGC